MPRYSWLADEIIGWCGAIGLVCAIAATAYGYGVEHGKQQITVKLPANAVCRINADGSRLCRTPHVSDYSKVERARIALNHRRAV